jgi:hypothetical protein
MENRVKLMRMSLPHYRPHGRRRIARTLTIAAGVLVTAGLLAGQPSAQASSDRLSTNQTLGVNQSIVSTNGEYELIMQGDGNLVEYFQGRALWASSTQGHPGAYAIMQGDGNLVVYRPGGAAVWASGTHGPGVWAVMQGDGNFVVYSAGGTALWVNGAFNDHLTSGQSLHAGQTLQSSNRSYQLAMQGDGNLVEYTAGGLPLWNSQTGGNSGAWAVMQGDGNLVVYSSGGTALWASGTHGSGVWAVMQNDSNFVVYTAGGTDLWDTFPLGNADPFVTCSTSNTWISPWYGSSDFQVRLFWSPACNTYWAQGTVQAGGILRVTDQHGDIGNALTSNSTVMVDGNGWGQGCIYDTSHGWFCTPKLTHN